MIETVQEKVRKLCLEESVLVSRAGQVFDVRDVAYFYTKEGTVKARIDNETIHTLDWDLGELEERFRGLFIRTHRSYLVNVKRIAGASRRYPGGKEIEELLAAGPVEVLQAEKEREEECELHLAGCKDTVPVTSTYAGAVKELLGISTFAHLVPDHPEDRRHRELDIVDFAWRELQRLDPADEAAVTAYKEHWDVKTFDKPRLKKYFRRVTSEEIDKRKFIRNIIWQLHRWYGKGIAEPQRRSIRAFWYRMIKPSLGHHGDLLEPNDDDIFYDVLEKMILEEKLFKYRDLGFQDVNADNRRIGERRPEIILEAEKKTFKPDIIRLADEFGITYICHERTPGNLSLEYFSDELYAAAGEKPLIIFTISDLNPPGFFIERFFLKRLQWYGHELARVCRLVDLSEEAFPDQSVIQYQRCPVAKYKETDDGVITPTDEWTMGQVTKAREWLETVMMNNPWLHTKEEYEDAEHGGTLTYHTIWGVESDAPKIEHLEKRFRRVMAELGFGSGEMPEE